MPHGFSRHGQEDSEREKHDDVGDVKSLLFIVVEPSGKECPVYMIIPRYRRARQNGKLEHAVAVGHEGKQPYEAECESECKYYGWLFAANQKKSAATEIITRQTSDDSRKAPGKYPNESIICVVTSSFILSISSFRILSSIYCVGRFFLTPFSKEPPFHPFPPSV